MEPRRDLRAGISAGRCGRRRTDLASGPGLAASGWSWRVGPGCSGKTRALAERASNADRWARGVGGSGHERVGEAGRWAAASGARWQGRGTCSAGCCASGSAGRTGPRDAGQAGKRAGRREGWVWSWAEAGLKRSAGLGRPLAAVGSRVLLGWVLVFLSISISISNSILLLS